MPRPRPAQTPTRATIIRGARMHNLRGINCQIPLQKITVITGVSGSGKSSLAFDVLYAEGQRRFVECLSAYARQFLERLERPDVDHIGHIQPPIALKQRAGIRNARSTVGSITELSDHMRLLFAHAGEVHCAQCGGLVARMDPHRAVAAIADYPPGTHLMILAPLGAVPDHAAAREMLHEGYPRLCLDGAVHEIEELPEDLSGRQEAALVIDRIIAGKAAHGRTIESIQAAWLRGAGICHLQPLDGEVRTLRQGLACRDCGAPAVAPSEALFSWNSPIGACPECQGFGRIITIDRDKVVPNPRKNLRNHAVVPFSVPSAEKWYRRLLRAARAKEIPTDVPFGKLPPDAQDWVFAGDGDFPGVTGFFEQLEAKRYKMHVRIFIARFRGYRPCLRCGGARLRPEALAVHLGGSDIQQLHEMAIDDLRAFFEALDPPAAGVTSLLENIRTRLAYLTSVGVGYLAPGRAGRTLSGGETQRIRLAAALGSALSDTLYILDEPTVGLHAIDSQRMLVVLRELTAMGNSVVVVEHDPEIIAGADHLIILGPGGGHLGGKLIYEGRVAPFLKDHPDFFLAQPQPPSGRRRRPAPVPGISRGDLTALHKLRNPWDSSAVAKWQRASQARPEMHGPLLTIRDAGEHNLKIAKLALPLSRLVVFTGVSGSGKSTLLDGVIYRNWLRRKGEPVEDVGRVTAIDGLDVLAEMHLVAQGLLGRSSRSNPVSFVKAFEDVRKLLANTIAAKQRKLSPGAFSFNTSGGRCATCKGLGTQTLEMYFLPDVEVPCEACGGRRFRPEVLAVTWRGKNIDEILKLTVAEATDFFRSESAIVARLGPLREVGLDYLRLGQSTSTLSGGEAQRLRLAAHLARGTRTERHLFLFDEPTTGLHARDVEKLLRALRGLLQQGHGVFVVEHHLDFIAAADWVVDLGPGPGAAGGRVVYSGSVAGLLEHGESKTGAVLRRRMARSAD